MVRPKRLTPATSAGANLTRSEATGGGNPSTALHSMKPEPRTERAQIVGIARENRLPESVCAERNVAIRDVFRVGAGQEQAHEAGLFVIKGNDLHVGKSQEGGQPRLPRRVAPGLRDAARRDRDRVVRPSRLPDEDGERSVSAIERDERAGVEYDARHAAPRRSLRARARSAPVAGPPVTSRTCSTRRSKSASAASCAATACSMYADTLFARSCATTDFTLLSNRGDIEIASFTFGFSIPLFIP